MTTSEKTFLLLLSDGIGTGLRPDLTPLSEEDRRSVFKLAVQHHVLPLIVDEVYRRDPASLPAAFEQYRKRAMRIVSIQTAKTASFLSLYRHLSEQGLEPLVMKGIICRELYPVPDFRFSADEDLLIRPEEAAAYHEALTSYGLKTDHTEEDAAAAHETGYVSEDRMLLLEVHRTPFPAESAAYGEYNDLFTEAYENAVTAVIDGVPVRTLSPTDHLLYLICHAMKHFLHGGFGIRQVCDICLFAKKNGQDIDWERTVLALKKIRAEVFTASLFSIGERYLNIGTPWKEGEEPLPVSTAEPEALLSDILDSGVYGASTASRKHSSNITLSALEREKKKGAGRISSWRRILFPPAADLRERYTYLKKHPVLLPVAWIQRIFGYVRSGSRKDGSAKEALRIGKERTALLEKYGLVGVPEKDGRTEGSRKDGIPKKVVDTGAYVSSLLELVREGHEVSLPVVGSSMVPFLGDGRDRVFLKSPEGKLRKGDVVLYQRDNGDYVLHRICRIRKRDGETLYDMAGDSQTRVEKNIRRDQIRAKTVRIERKGKLQTPGTLYWWFFQHIWVNLIPVRHLLLHAYSAIR